MRNALFVVSGLVALVITGCAGPQLPAGPSPSDVVRFQQAEARSWWEAMYPGDPMPTVTVVQYSTPETRDELATACVDQALGYPTLTDYSTRAYSIATWTCYAEYPLDPNGEHQRLSTAQLAYTYSYFNERTVPCLERMGYDVPFLESKVLLLEAARADLGYLVWSPYWAVLSEPMATDADRVRMAEACPPPPFDYPWLG